MARNWIVWYVACLYAVWGILMLNVVLAGRDISGGVSWNIYVETMGIQFWGVWMLVASAMAITALLGFRGGALPVLFLIPQQTLLVVGVIGLILNFSGAYGGFEMSRILRVTPLAVGPLVFHTIAVLDHSGLIRKMKGR